MGQPWCRRCREWELGFIPNFSKEMAGCSTRALQHQKSLTHRPATICHVPFPTHPTVVGLGDPCRTLHPCLLALLECVTLLYFICVFSFFLNICGIYLRLSILTFIAAMMMSTTEKPINNMNVPYAGPFMGPTLFDLLICKLFYWTTQLSSTAV